MNVLLSLVVLSVLIIVHELGHFAAARLNGIRVLEFSIFMGPKLFSIKGKETEYSFRLIPMGGFVRMEGEETASEDDRAYSRKKVWQRFTVIFAGPFMNLLLAFLLISIFTARTGYLSNRVSELGEDSPLKAAGMSVGDELLSFDGTSIHDTDTDLLLYVYGGEDGLVDVTYRNATTGEVVKRTAESYRTPARYRLGFTVSVDAGGNPSNVIDIVETSSDLQLKGARHGDAIIALNGSPMKNREEIANWLNSEDHGASPVDVTVLRNGQEIVLEDVQPFVDASLSVDADFAYVEHPTFLQTAGAAWDYSISTVRSVYRTLGWLFTGKVSFNQISGPVGIVGTINSVVEREPSFMDKLMSLFGLGALLSLNLGVMNLIPFPALDGSKLLLLIVEKLRGRPIPPEKESLITMIGFVLLIAVLIATLFNDIPRFIL